MLFSKLDVADILLCVMPCQLVIFNITYKEKQSKNLIVVVCVKIENSKSIEIKNNSNGKHGLNSELYT